MEPLKPSDKRRILESSPAAQPGDIEEYERLLALRFTVDPDMRPPAAPVKESAFGDLMSFQERESRIAELYQKLYPDQSKDKF